MHIYNVLLVVTLPLISATGQGLGNGTILRVYNGGEWGSWGHRVWCPKGSFAEGYQIKLEDYQGSGDDTALNNIRLICSGNHKIDGYVNSVTWGRWSDPVKCPKGQYLTRFQLRVEAPQGDGDDTAANAIKFRCRAKDSHTISYNILTINETMQGAWGVWGDWSLICWPHSVICGMEIKFESALGDGDDTALNDVRFICCE